MVLWLLDVGLLSVGFAGIYILFMSDCMVPFISLFFSLLLSSKNSQFNLSGDFFPFYFSSLERKTQVALFTLYKNILIPPSAVGLRTGGLGWLGA